MDTNNNIELVKDFISSYKKFKEEISKVIIGQDNVVDQVLMSIFCDGHSLLVGVPGLAKTLLIQTISNCLGLKFNRIQFTPDLMPSDIVGSEILDNNRSFKFLKGPIFSNIILADEINRTPPKTQGDVRRRYQNESRAQGCRRRRDRLFTEMWGGSIEEGLRTSDAGDVDASVNWCCERHRRPQKSLLRGHSCEL